ncbi:MAG TPA: hypothetical protein VFJ17_11375 [Mycobacteriales bacterium]|jgi:hypothetical protein|nr:hypothetical protein [Mycobacteriales bacterium]
MRTRLILAAGAAAAVAAATVPSQAAGAKVLDGKKTKSLSFNLATSPQTNDYNLVTDFTDLAAQTPVSRPDMGNCPATRCLSYSFVYKPAKGVKPGPFSVKISWTIPGQDYDLYVIQDGGDVGHCGASAGTSEVVDIMTPVKGKTYKVVIDQYRAGPDTITGKVAFPATDKVGSTAPSVADDNGLSLNCGLS